MALNQALPNANNFQLPCPAAANSGVGPNANDPLVFGRGTCPNFGLAVVVQTSYTPPTGTPTGFCSLQSNGAWFLSVTAKDDIGGSAVNCKPGDAVYATGGTYDPVTNCLYGFTLTRNSTSGVYFGEALDEVTAGETATIRVRLKNN